MKKRFCIDCENKNTIILFGLYFLLSIFFAASSLYLVVFRANGAIDFKIAPFVLTFVFIILALGVFLFLRYGKEKAYFFLILVIPIGMFFVFFMLPTAVPDEIWHIYRTMTVFQDSGSHMVVPHEAGLNIPAATFSYSDFYDCLTSSTDWSNVFIVERDMSQYLSIHYLIAGFFFQIARLLGLNYWICTYVASLSNFALFCIVGFVFLRRIPFGKNVSLVFLLNPMLIQQEASCSADAVCNICAILFVLFLLDNYFSSKPSKKNLLAMVCFALLMSVCKVGAYSPMCLLMLVFLFKVQDSKKRTSLICLCCVVGILLYIYLVYFYEGALFPEARELMRNPSRLLFVLFNTFKQYFALQFRWYFGSSLGSLDIFVPIYFWVLYLLLQIFVLVVPERYNGRRLCAKEKLTLTIVCAIELFAIYMAQVSWAVNRDGNFDVITGVQGRYFIPIIIVILLCYCRLRKTSDSSLSLTGAQTEICKNDDLQLRVSYYGCVCWIKNNYVNLIVAIVACYVYLGAVLAVVHHFGV